MNKNLRTLESIRLEFSFHVFPCSLNSYCLLCVLVLHRHINSSSHRTTSGSHPTLNLIHIVDVCVRKGTYEKNIMTPLDSPSFFRQIFRAPAFPIKDRKVGKKRKKTRKTSPAPCRSSALLCFINIVLFDARQLQPPRSLRYINKVR